MWLLPHFARLSGAAVRVYYRPSRSGAPVPASGPVLLVGNHPNSLLDPAVMAWAAERPLRFLAKEPLFRDKVIGWLVRGSGSIPVYRAQDDPSLMGQNRDAFAAAHAALAAGSAIAMFPEGISHDGSALAPLKTGAARIAFGAAAQLGGAFPIVPVGLVFRAKDRFRSEVHAIVGAPVAWEDLAARALAASAAAAQNDATTRRGVDRDLVHELTRRIGAAMRAVTLNLAQWEDEAVLRTAEAIWAHERRAERGPAAQVARLARAGESLARLRADGDPQWDALARDVLAHGELLARLQITPADVGTEPQLGAALRWVARRITVVGVGQAALAAILAVLFWIPYRFTGWIAARKSPSRDTLSTYRVIAGTMTFTLWIVGLSIGAAWWVGIGWGVAACVALPIIAIGGLYALEHWQETLATARRWVALRRGDPRLGDLPLRQASLAARIDEAVRHAEVIAARS